MLEFSARPFAKIFSNTFSSSLSHTYTRTHADTNVETHTKVHERREKKRVPFERKDENNRGSIDRGRNKLKVSFLVLAKKILSI